ncbi:cryptochrome/photolyase family protein [Robertkochia aurantiaca]|uniref:cryptochrome/photolyase family protein n=1 Tax=Robertkochia aurantiaca TaxID=2873700 RepID=UPI001CCE1113|nr:cryptochrome/photolyase family protein [Robertkochia sp. 3YJGBD-33]
MATLRLILGDQLNYNHSWFRETNDNITYLMAEMRQETDYVKHHVQKVCAFFLAMRSFADHLKKQGLQVHYYKLDMDENPHKLKTLLEDELKQGSYDRFEYMEPDEFRLDKQLKEICNDLDIDTGMTGTEHFYTERSELSEFFKGKKQLLMENFYRHMRKKHKVLMNNDNPEGGEWNYDQSNRKKWKGEPKIPEPLTFENDPRPIKEMLEKNGVRTIGNLDENNFNWPVNREQTLQLLDHFCDRLLPHFGDYQDAMHTETTYLFHSRLSFSLNSKMINPEEIVNKVEDHYYQNKEEIDISQAEGFIRQILGWREYMRGIYWKEMPGYKSKNALDNHNDLPGFYWTGDTRMKCLQHAIKQSLNNAYAHHIQRLMVTGNFALLMQCEPEAVDEWYLGIYADAIEWVELTNTRGMSQYADGGVIATKPYISSANYINKMGNYCKECHYYHSKKTGERACPFNALYWNFLEQKRERLKNNPRMGMMYSLLDKMDKNQLEAIMKRADKIMKNPDEF